MPPPAPAPPVQPQEVIERAREFIGRLDATRYEAHSAVTESERVAAWTRFCAVGDDFGDHSEQLVRDLLALVLDTETDLNGLRIRAFESYRTDRGGDHSTACLIWGEDGQGGWKGERPILPCSCGMWPEWLKAERDRLRALVLDNQDRTNALRSYLSHHGGCIKRICKYTEGQCPNHEHHKCNCGLEALRDADAQVGR